MDQQERFMKGRSSSLAAKNTPGSQYPASDEWLLRTPWLI